MRAIRILPVALFLNAFSATSQCANASNIYSFSYNGKNYEIVKENKSWQDAAACAVERGGYLAEINDAAENAAIYSEITTNAGVSTANTSAPDGGGASYLWIGGNDIASEGVWIWDGNNDASGPQFWQGTTSGSPVGGLYNNWGNEPDNYGAGQDGLGLAISNWPYGVASQWNDIYTSNTLYFVIEYDSSSAGLPELDHSMLLMPNPSTDQISIHCENTSNIKIYNLQGTLIEERTDPDPQDNLIEVKEYKNGVYFVVIGLTDGSMIKERFIIK